MNTITSRSATEFLLHEKFQALLSELDTVGDNASYGHVLDDIDDFLFTAKPSMTSTASEQTATISLSKCRRHARSFSKTGLCSGHRF